MLIFWVAPKAAVWVIVSLPEPVVTLTAVAAIVNNWLPVAAAASILVNAVPEALNVISPAAFDVNVSATVHVVAVSVDFVPLLASKLTVFAATAVNASWFAVPAVKLTFTLVAVASTTPAVPVTFLALTVNSLVPAAAVTVATLAVVSRFNVVNASEPIVIAPVEPLTLTEESLSAVVVGVPVSETPTVVAVPVTSTDVTLDFVVTEAAAPTALAVTFVTPTIFSTFAVAAALDITFIVSTFVIVAVGSAVPVAV